MITKGVTFGFIAVACAVASALAQTGAGPFITRGDLYARASKLTGVEVIGADNTRIGEVEELLVDASGRIAGVVIGVGGFLGIGEKRVAVPFDKILWNYGDVGRNPSQSASGPRTPDAASPGPANAERMPGAGVSNEVLNADEQNRSATVDASTGPVTTPGAGQTAATTPLLNPGRNPVRAVVLLSKADLERAPALEYERR
jgi:sporulation protein YlmC with PRC-barrel domain